jgi:hypothetical protein
MKRSILALIPLLTVAVGCFDGSSSTPTGPASTGSTRLTVVVHGFDGTKPWHSTSTLRCLPPGGTHSAPQAACSALADLIARDAIPPRHCRFEMSGPWTTVTGQYRGTRISLAYAEACATDKKSSLQAQTLGVYFSHG